MIHVLLVNSGSGDTYRCANVSIEGGGTKILIHLDGCCSADYLMITSKGGITTYNLNVMHVLSTGDTFTVNMPPQFVDLYREAMGYLYQDVL